MEGQEQALEQGLVLDAVQEPLQGSARTQFKKGQSGNPSGKRKVRDDDVIPGTPFDQLAVMQHVLDNPPSADRTHSQKLVRQWAEDKTSAFMDRYTELSKEARSQQVVQRDEGTARLIPLIEKLLRVKDE